MLAALARDLRDRAADRARFMVAIAGAPGSGKSTLAAGLCAALNADGTVARVVPMDGFHYDDRVLGPRGDLPRKGAPHTFDVLGLIHMVARLRAEPEVAIPIFDRDIEIARAGAAVVTAQDRILLVEGNYLLLDQEPWRQLRPLFDLTLFLDVPEAVLERRLISRWMSFNHTRAAAELRAEENDLPNARLVARQSSRPDRRLGFGPQGQLVMLDRDQAGVAGGDGRID